jgi:hypothetical protein
MMEITRLGDHETSESPHSGPWELLEPPKNEQTRYYIKVIDGAILHKSNIK